MQLEIRRPRKSLVPALQQQHSVGPLFVERRCRKELSTSNGFGSLQSACATAIHPARPSACSLEHHYIPLQPRTSARSRSAIRSDDTFPDSTVVRPYYTGESLDLGRSQGPLMNNKLVSSPRGPPLGFARSARNRVRIPIVMFRIGLGEGENYITLVRPFWAAVQ